MPDTNLLDALDRLAASVSPTPRDLPPSTVVARKASDLRSTLAAAILRGNRSGDPMVLDRQLLTAVDRYLDGDAA